MGFSYDFLAHTLRDLNKLDEAVAAFHKAITIRELLVEEHPKVEEHTENLGFSYYWLARTLRDLNKLDEAVAAFHKTITIRELLVEEHPKVAEYTERLGFSYYYLGELNASVGDYVNAAILGERIAQLKVPDDQPDARGLNLYNAACLFSVVSGAAAKDENLPEADRATLADKHAARALALLKEDRTLGYFKDPEILAHMKKDPDLDPLRDRDDFKQLVKELEEDLQK
jgi:tetratricopeptide (TPR) repeat protein